MAFDSGSNGILLRRRIRACTHLAGRSLLQFQRQFGSGPTTTISTVASLFGIDRFSVDTKLRQLTLEAAPLVKKSVERLHRQRYDGVFRITSAAMTLVVAPLDIAPYWWLRRILIQ